MPKIEYFTCLKNSFLFYFSVLLQTRYNSPKSEINEQGQSWVIHVICTRQSSPDFYETNLIFWNLPNQPNVLENGAETNEWILCNVQQTGKLFIFP